MTNTFEWPGIVRSWLISTRPARSRGTSSVAPSGEAATPAAQFLAAKDLMTAEVDLVKADLAVRVAAAQLLNLIGRHQ